MRQLRGGATTGEIAGHIMVNSLENNLLDDYDPYATPNSAGDIDEGQGRDGAVEVRHEPGRRVRRAGVLPDILAMTDREDPYPKQAALIAPIMEQIGLTFDVKELERTTMYTKCNDLNAHAAICLGPGVGQGLPGRLHVRGSAVRLELALAELLQLHRARAPLRTSSRSGATRR